MDKIQVYAQVIDFFAKFTNPEVQARVRNSPKEQAKLGWEMALIGMQLALVGSDGVVTKYITFRGASLITTDAVMIVKAFGELMLEMRRDLYTGEGDITQCTADDMLDAFIVETGPEKGEV